MQILILDTETTSVEGQAIEIAFIEIEYPSLKVIWKNDYFYKPTEPIALGAKATHHILESDLIGYPDVFSEHYNETVAFLNDTDYIIGHNCDFDCKILGLTKPKRIDTLALARKLLPALDSKSQSALMYHFFGDEARDKIRNAHNALCDVENCLLVLKELLEVYWDNNWAFNDSTKLQDINDLYEFSEFCRIPTTMTFGKHYGKTYLEVAKIDPGYFSWWRTKSDTPPDEYQNKAINIAFEQIKQR